MATPRPSRTTLSVQVETYARRPDADKDTVSAETLGLTHFDVAAYIEHHPTTFMKQLNKLSGEDQELLLAYFVLRRPQREVAKLHRSTQTITSRRTGDALARLYLVVALKEVTSATIEPVLSKAGLENILPQPLSKLIARFCRNCDWDEIAIFCDKTTIVVRRAFRRAQKQVSESRKEIERALAAWMEGAMYRACKQAGESAEQEQDRLTAVASTLSFWGPILMGLSSAPYAINKAGASITEFITAIKRKAK